MGSLHVLQRLPQRLRQLRLPLTDELFHVGSAAARRALVISNFPIFPAPFPVMSLSNHAGQAQPAARAWPGCEEPRSCTPLPRLPASAWFSVICPCSGLFQKPCLHATEGRRESYLKQLRRDFLSIWDHLSIWRQRRFLFSLPQGSRRGAPARTIRTIKKAMLRRIATS